MVFRLYLFFVSKIKAKKAVLVAHLIGLNLNIFGFERVIQGQKCITNSNSLNLIIWIIQYHDLILTVILQ